jgi:hypothetical protein
MSATRLDVTADVQQGTWEASSAVVDLTRPRLVRHLTPRRGPVQCPECRSIIYSRRHKLCGVCSQPLPEDLLFTMNEAKRIQRIVDSERARHRQWLAQHASGD